ncbi:MAG: hypothetical protein GXO35_02330 [Gammaproteobacteria bacterium]|nr:hypothetical protein [Gammaproteobacteria bacterium]
MSGEKHSPRPNPENDRDKKEIKTNSFPKKDDSVESGRRRIEEALRRAS